MNILIAAHYNLNNGDRALLEATIRIIQSIYPGCNITVSAYRPDLFNDDRFKPVGWALGNGKRERILLKLSQYKICRSFFRKTYSLICDEDYLKAVRSADVVFLSGGHHLTDILSSKVYYKLASNFLIPILEHKRVVLLPQSIGPAKDENVKQSISFILNNAYSVAYRDESSRLFVESLNARCSAQYVPDLVFSIIPQISEDVDNKTVGIALYHSYAGEKKETLLPYILTNLCKVVEELIDRNYCVKVIPMDINDEVIVDHIKNNLPNDKREKFYLGNSYESIIELISEFSTVHFTLAFKTHSTVFSMICNTPLVAIAYHPKSIEFMQRIGLQEYAINDTEASFDNIMKLIDKIEENYTCIKETEISGVNNNRALIDNYIAGVLNEND